MIMGQLENKRLLVKVATLYYQEELTQQEISEALRISRPKVSRLLRQAREQGIVQITIVKPSGVFPHLERALEQRYGLQEAVIVEVQDYTSPNAVAGEIGAAAAEYLHRTIQPGDVVGVSWGRTLAAMVNACRPEAKTGTAVVQITGGLGPPVSEVHASGLATRLAAALGAEVHLLAAPGVVDSPEAREALLRDSHVHRTLELARRASMVFVGIGTPSRDSIVMQIGEILAWDEMEHLLEMGAVGDVALHYFDIKGRPVEGMSSRVIALPPDQLKKIPRRVGVAGGTGKFEAILGAILGGWINCLITDHVTAQRLLEVQIGGTGPASGKRSPRARD